MQTYEVAPDVLKEHGKVNFLLVHLTTLELTRSSTDEEPIPQRRRHFRWMPFSAAAAFSFLSDVSPGCVLHHYGLTEFKVCRCSPDIYIMHPYWLALQYYTVIFGVSRCLFWTWHRKAWSNCVFSIALGALTQLVWARGARIHDDLNRLLISPVYVSSARSAHRTAQV